ncbi:MAG: hypothetical protein IPO92_15165 [Saprospiraceae bacterium]|nr:hypothetical protein [Saprospiraceae bacterium]
MKYLLFIIISCLLLFSGYGAVRLLNVYATLKSQKEDLAEINKINYGLFNLQIWKKEALKVFENRIANFEVSPRAYDQVVIELEKYLRGINKEYVESGKIFDNIFEEAEKSPTVNKVFLKLIRQNAAPQIKLLNIPKYIPGMAVELANELKKQEPQLRDIMRIELKRIIKDDENSAYDRGRKYRRVWCC